jgi:type II secretory pathway predicted ATPase ExeA
VGGYIQHRLTHVGGTGNEFTGEALDLIAEHTRGIPRLVNKLCDFAMVYAATEERQIVDAAIIEEVLEDGIFLPAVTSTGEAAE